jgi:thioredoxin 1
VQAVSRDDFLSEVVDASKVVPVLVDLWGARCGPCLRMMPWIEKLAEQTAGSMKVVKLNADENRRLCVELGIMGLPTFLLYRDGQEVQRLTGSDCTPARVRALLPT